MPTSGTHITVLQRVALANNNKWQGILGNPLSAGEDSTEGLKTRYANLGALGPDIFYAMADYSSDLQDLENFLVKIGGTFECLADLSGAIGKAINDVANTVTLGLSGEIEKTFNYLASTVVEKVLALLVDAGYSFWPVFEPARQQDLPRKRWFWADYLHYVRTGQFAQQLLINSKKPQYAGHPNLYAYALGYLTHYVTDVVGHPYVNQVVQAPWRLYWQRHHLVENFIDGYVWDRWHVSNPGKASDAEPPLDSVTSTPNETGTGAPYSYSRLNDHVNVGRLKMADPVDQIVKGICETIGKGLFDIGIAVPLDPVTPTDLDFSLWTQMMAETLKQVYNEPKLNGEEQHPMNLSLPPGYPFTRPDGYPTKEDIGAAYGTFRLMLKVATESTMEEPVMPDISGDISAIMQQLQDDIAKAIQSIPPLPQINISNNLNLSKMCDALTNTAQWILDVFMAVGEVVFAFIKTAAQLLATIVVDAVKYALYLLNKALYSLYRTLHFTLVMSGNATPFTEDLSVQYTPTDNTQDLWRSQGDPAYGAYPSEEDTSQREWYKSTYRPFVPPRSVSAKVEQPPIAFGAPYAPKGKVPTLPDAFLDSPVGDNMFTSSQGSGPEPAVASSSPGTFYPDKTGANKRNYGGAVANCLVAIQLVESGAAYQLPDYNLDGDRGYGWPTWDVNPAPTVNAIGDPLNPADPTNSGGIATANASLITG